MCVSVMSDTRTHTFTARCRGEHPYRTHVLVVLISRAMHTRTHKYTHIQLRSTHLRTYARTLTHTHAHTLFPPDVTGSLYTEHVLVVLISRAMHTRTRKYTHIYTRAHTHVHTPFQLDVAGILFAEHVLVVSASRAKRPNPPTVSISHVPLPSRHFL